ncbi:hypothetical protein V8E53_011736 [Lactarius tabidus]
MDRKQVFEGLSRQDQSNPTALETLIALDLDPTIPTILAGDFNTHSPSWLAPGWGKSLQADKLKTWLASQTFNLLSEPGQPMRRGTTAANERDSVLDLLWVNMAAEHSLYFTLLEIDWTGSMGSDHALLRCTVYPNSHIPWHPKEEVTGYKVDNSKVEEWVQALESTRHFAGIPPLDSITDMDLAVDILFDRNFREEMPHKPQQMLTLVECQL